MWKDSASVIAIIIMTVMPSAGLIWVANQVDDPVWHYILTFSSYIMGASMFAFSFWTALSLSREEQQQEIEKMLKEQDAQEREFAERLEERGF